MGGFERICWILTILASIGALAILGTVVGVRLIDPSTARASVAGVSRTVVPLYAPMCCENFS